MARAVKMGIILPQIEGRKSGTTPGWKDIQAVAQKAEEVGFDSLWLVDHLLYGFSEEDPARGVWECWSLMAALAAVTERAELGQVVTATAFRNPALLAKMADTVDEISGGRVILGLGAGYYKLEYDAFGYPYDHRYSRFEEALQIIATLLREGKIDFEGRFYSARECELRPRGPRPDGLPILIGTSGEKMLRLKAQHADQWNGWLVRGRNRPEDIAEVRAKVDAACAEVGRDPATLQRTATIMFDLDPRAEPSARGPITGSPEQVAEAIRAFGREGISHIQVAGRPPTPATLERWVPVFEALDKG
jgi:alkanesulfonate monooxygenase SsuD/methylene tetrahydromethanopterin reductase-like flavin-dependent oxidoreductase (luciferase family)